MWLATSSLYLALLSFTDTWFFLHIALAMSVDRLLLGIANAAWSIVFVVSNILFGRAVEAGRNKLGAAASSVLLCLSTIVIASSGRVIDVVIAYSVLHAISTSLGRISVNVTILENTSYDTWNKYNLVSNASIMVVRGVLLVLVCYGYISGIILLPMVAASSLLYVLTLPSILFPIERNIYRLSKQLDRIHNYLRFTSIFPEILGNGLTAARSFEIRWDVERDVPAYRPLLAVLTMTMSSEAIFVLVPLLLSGNMGKEQTLLSYGISSIASAMVLIVIARLSTSRLLVALTGIVRAFLIPLIVFKFGIAEAVLYLVSTAVLFNMFNASNYSIYVKSSAGQRTFLYGVAVELGIAAGSILGGVLASWYGILYVVILSTAGHVLASLISLL